ncbi:hypothetical protein LIA77_02881 [Sarocladium implicatum]|nr:hypothetical protein LIA77_02881 [Sarocladium implicatum]
MLPSSRLDRASVEYTLRRDGPICFVILRKRTSLTEGKSSADVIRYRKGKSDQVKQWHGACCSPQNVVKTPLSDITCEKSIQHVDIHCSFSSPCVRVSFTAVPSGTGPLQVTA